MTHKKYQVVGVHMNGARTILKTGVSLDVAQTIAGLVIIGIKFERAVVEPSFEAEGPKSG